MSYIHKKKQRSIRNKDPLMGLNIGSPHLLPGCEYVKAGEGGVVS